jgi:protein-tyrosine phosphatase
MLRMAIDQGVTTQILTPHIHLGRFNNTKEQLVHQFILFKEAVDQANLPITLQLSAECRIGPEIMQLVTQNAIPWLGEFKGKRTFLLEFPRTEIPFGSDNLVKWLLTKNCLPVIVHPERNSTFIVNKNKLQMLIDLGCPIQITASSLTGKFGKEVQKMSEELLVAGQVSAIASDCHNLKGRAPDLRAGLEKASSLISPTDALKLVTKTPRELCFK